MAASVESTPELLAGFLDEAVDHIEALRRCLTAFELDAGNGAIDFQRPDDAERINDIFRAAHGLKGLSSVFGFDDINHLTHLMEALFDDARLGRRTIDVHAHSVLLECVGVLESLVDDLRNPAPTHHDISASMHQLDELLGTSPPPAAPARETPLMDITSAISGLPSNVLDDPDLRKSFIDCTEEAIDELVQRLLTLEKDTEEDALNDVFRVAHTLKGGFGAAALHDATQLTHRMESLFDELRSNSRTLNESTMAALLGAADRLREVVDTVKSDSYVPMNDELLNSIFAQLDQPAPTSAALAAAPEGTQAVTSQPPADAAPTPASEWAGFAPSEILASAGRGYDIFITFVANDPERELQAFVILNKLRSTGDIAWMNPNIETGSMGDNLTQHFVMQLSDATPAEARKLQATLATFKVLSVRVACFDITGNGAPTGDLAVPHDAEAEPAADAITSAPSDAATMPIEAAADVNEFALPIATAASPSRATAPSVNAARQRPAPMVTTETIRVDVERLDQLMNLGGELVINRARFSEVARHFKSVFEGKDFSYIADDLSNQFEQMRQDIRAIATTSSADVSALTARLSNISHDFDAVHQLIGRVHDARPALHSFDEAVNTLDRISEGLQKRIMETRMVPVGPLFQRFQRLTRDLAKDLNKQIELVMSGEQTELDKKMIDDLADPLTHIIRNSADHGIELPNDRVRAGKNLVATVTLMAYHQGNNICIDVKDDGRGLDLKRIREKIVERGLAAEPLVAQMSDHDLIQYVFHPGFSTAKKVSDLSGRGMGMDIVKTKIANLNGTVEMESVPGVGTTVRIKLPLTLAIIRALQTRVGGEVFAIPLESVAEIVSIQRSDIRGIQGQRIARVRNNVVPVCLLEEMFDPATARVRTSSVDSKEWTIVIIESQSNRLGLVVDQLIGQEDIVIKSLAENYRNVPGFSGATIMGDGRIALILDVGFLAANRGPSN